MATDDPDKPESPEPATPTLDDKARAESSSSSSSSSSDADAKASSPDADAKASSPDADAKSDEAAKTHEPEGRAKWPSADAEARATSSANDAEARARGDAEAARTLEDEARAQHHVQAGIDQRRRGQIELGIGGFCALAGIAAAYFVGDALFTMFGLLLVSTFILVGIGLAATGLVHILANRQGAGASEVILATHRRRIIRGYVEIVLGIVGIAAGVTITFLTYKKLSNQLDRYIIPYIPFVLGYVALVMGTLRVINAEEGLVKPETAAGKRNEISIGFGFRTFVAWRYLMARHHRISRIVLAVFFVALFAAAVALMLWYTVMRPWNPLELQPETYNGLVRVVLIAMIGGFALLYFSVIIAGLRYVFSFFTTVPIVGVWIGTAALIIVLSVMSGFETDLRQKILGSNAHIQVTGEGGEISDWQNIKARIDKIPGVLASTPYAVSEVVIAANNNGMNVIIKGIDPATVGKVTKLIQSIKDDKEGAMKRLEPLVDDSQDLTVPQPTPGTGQGSDVVDPPPPDMPGRGEPIDFSEPAEGTAPDDDDDADADDSDLPDPDAPPPLDPAPPAGGSAKAAVEAAAKDAKLPEAKPATSSDEPATSGSKPATKPAGKPTKPADAEPYGGDAEYLVEKTPLVDPPPDDIITSTEPPIDYSGDNDDDVDLPIEVTDIPYEPSVARRTQLLPGILVGQELVKQTHLYVGEEVRVVSPLSDPSNPDATGTPIPFNRDYRVAGIFFTGMYEYDLKYVYVTLDSLTDFLDRGDVVDGIEIRISDPDETEAMVKTLQRQLGGNFRVQDWKELNRSLFSALKLEKIAMFLVLGIVILVASFSIVGNLIMVVVEKAREIALIKTLGAADMNVMLVFAIQGLLIGVVGTGLGVVTGLLVCWVLKEFGFPLNPDVYYIDQLPVHVDGSSVMLTAVAGVMISMLATFYPAVVAARVRPAAGMRH